MEAAILKWSSTAPSGVFVKYRAENMVQWVSKGTFNHTHEIDV